MYSFRAAVPRYFVETDVNQTVNGTSSYRCPEAIVLVARGVLEAHPETDPNGFTAKGDGGHAERRAVGRPGALADLARDDVETHSPNDDGNTVFMLTRTNRQKWNIGGALEDEGVSFSYIGTSEKYQPWRGEMQLIHRGLAAIRDG